MSLHIQALRSTLGPTPAAIEGHRSLTSYICQIWRRPPNIAVYNQLVGAMMTHPTDAQYFYISCELSFLASLYRTRLSLEGIHD